MRTYSFDVVIIGAGPAGVSAAGALAGSGLSVALLEAGVYAGAENWSGCVYFAESLAEPDCFGPAVVQNAPFERQVVRRGTLVHNGLDEVGVSLSDPAAFRHCYTVLRPIYDPYFADHARSRGVTVLARTTVTSLIRKSGRVIGVSTDRGPLYASVVFLAEGDASHLVRSEALEQVREPHYLQGVKAVLSLPEAEIGKRFGLRQGEGAAFEILVRNGAIGGRTAKLNVGGFLYTNRDSLSLGCVVPLDNLKKHFRGDHSRLLEWMQGLPYISDLVQGAGLSAYGTKIIRSGGWKERPVLAEDGLAVGGASTGLGIDIPFPNFTGPASASGLYFARAVKALLADGRSLDAKNLTETYVRPLEASVYGRNAAYLSAWPAYFSRTSVLFGRTADVVCGSARFLSSGSIMETGRFLRGHILSLRGIRELAGDTVAALSALRLGGPLVATILHPATIGSWFANIARKPGPDERLRLIMNIGGGKADPFSLPRPLGGLLRRLGPGLADALAAVYANDGIPLQKKFRTALRSLLRAFSITDLFVLPLFGLTLFLAAVASSVIDAFRFYVLKVPAQKLLAEPVMAYGGAQRKARDLDAAKPRTSLEAKLALNTYLVGSRSHIRTLWPDALASQTAMAQAGIWWVCPARVYSYDAPLFGRGKVTVNWENCIKCESCWRAEPSFALWGRSTDHRLIYRPASAALPLLLEARRELAKTSGPLPLPAVIDERLWYTAPAITAAAKAVLLAASSCREAMAGLPASADSTRRSWPKVMGERLCAAALVMEKLVLAEGRQDAAKDLQAEREAIAARFEEDRLFPALYGVMRLEQRLLAWIPELAGMQRSEAGPAAEAVSSQDVLKLFPDRIVKQWEEEPMPEDWAGKLRTFISSHYHPSRPAVRALSSVSPALGLIAACQMRALRLLSQSGRDAEAGLAAVDAEGVTIISRSGGALVRGTLRLVPTAASKALLLVEKDRGYVIPLTGPGVSVTPSPAIGFRAAGLSDIVLDSTVDPENIIALGSPSRGDAASYLAIALGAGDYLSRRAQEHAASRVQFNGQMLDTEGRDAIAKLGAVKAMIARVEAWRLLLETLYDVSRTLSHSRLRTPHSALDALFAAAAAMAFGPENGSMSYDAGQVFGGFAYSEDDLLSRFYRDSSLFPFLRPGPGASTVLSAALEGKDLKGLFSGPLGALPASAGRPVSDLALQWDDVRFWFDKVPADADPSLRGNAAALLLGIRALLSDAERSLRAGQSNEAKLASIEVLLDLSDDAVMRAALSAGSGRVAPSAVFPMEPLGGPVTLDLDYEDFCGRPAPPHRSGAFLVSVFDRSPRYVPEMQLHDRALRQRWQELADWFRTNCRDRDYDGRSFERYVEKRHDLPPAVIDAVKANAWLATYIPRAEDGLGWHKAEYYILNSAAGSFGDAAVCLLIMASTSIGTTPILLGLEEELPRVREELEPLARDEKPLAEIGLRLAKLIASFRNPNPAWIRREYEAVMRLVDSRIRHTRVVKYLAANFLRSFYAAGIAGQRGDFGGFMSNLEKAKELFTRLMPDVRAALAELPRRERCHKLFLRTLGHGGVSAFALTEPTAGSDSGGVKTTARLASVALTGLPDGRYSFSPAGGNGQDLRYLIDADRIVFTDRGAAYRTPDDTIAPIRYDRFDHAVSRGARYYEHQGTACLFHDIGQVRRTDKGLRYEYYSLTGSKMWITNGSLATQFSLFAQAPEGVTGFMVDRYAEGLKVGADERKTGQRGSPTNELALDNVRAPREAVIGYEGHGQVNALETLNVGRCGLAAVAGALARKIMAEARGNVPSSVERDRLLGEAAAIQFGSESLAYYLIGLFDRPHESVRMESAIAKYLCSEDIHEILSLVERAFGPAGQTEKHLVEKARRDARILNIYEGTNEVQRFLILKDLIAMAKGWPELPELPADLRAMTLTRWKNAVRKHARAAAELLGDTAWSDAMLQPGLFRLAELAGEVLRLECTWYRMEWLEARKGLLGNDYVAPLLAAGERAAERALARLGHLDRKYHTAWDRISSNRMPPEVHAADAVLDRTGRAEAAPVAARPLLTRPMKALCIVRAVADLPPSPLLDRGRLREIVWTADPHDRSCVDQALDLKTECGSLTVDVLLAGAKEHAGILRDVGASADRLFLLRSDADDPASVAAAVREIEGTSPYDLVLCGRSAAGGQGGLPAFLAGSMKRSFSVIERLDVAEDGTGIAGVTTPAVLSLASAGAAIPRTISSLIEAQALEIRSVGPAAALREVLYSMPRAAARETSTVTTVRDAAEFLKAYAASQMSARAEAFTGPLAGGTLPPGPLVWAVIDPRGMNANATALRAARMASGLFGREAAALVAAPRPMWQELLGLAKAHGMEQAFCLDTRDGLLSEEGRRHVLRLLFEGGSPIVSVSSEWNDACAFAAGEREGTPVAFCLEITDVRKNSDGHLDLFMPAYDGKLLRRERLTDGSALLTFSASAELPASSVAEQFSAAIVDLVLDARWTTPLPPQAEPTLGEADVIIDIGYGVRDSSGMELAKELRKKLESMGLKPLFGATRKVTQDLKLLPLDAQIGQTGVRVDPKLIIALGISGAPQHIDWIGTRADVLSFNKDSEAPFMKLNQTRPAPRVHPIPGDLFATVRELIEKLG